MMVEYKLTEKFTKEVIDELLDIQKKIGLTPEQILESARDKNSPLHEFFEWDNTLASEKYRLAQARILVNEVKVIIESKEYYAFESVAVSVPSGSKQKSETLVEHTREYVPVIEILSNEDLRQQIVRSALNHLSYWEKQNEKYSELTPIIKSAKKVRERLEKKWQKKKA